MDAEACQSLILRLVEYVLPQYSALYLAHVGLEQFGVVLVVLLQILLVALGVNMV